MKSVIVIYTPRPYGSVSQWKMIFDKIKDDIFEIRSQMKGKAEVITIQDETRSRIEMDVFFAEEPLITEVKMAPIDFKKMEEIIQKEKK